DDAAVVRPRESPFGIEVIVRIAFAFARAVAAFFGIDAAVNPAAARRRTVIFQIRIAADLFTIGDRVAVDLLENLFGVRLVVDAARASLGHNLSRVPFPIPPPTT